MSARANQSKSKAVKKPASNPAKTPAGNADAKNPKRSASKTQTFYLVVGYDARITDQKPKPGAQALEFSTFEEAKDRAVEQLIDLIDRSERRLWELKRAEDYDQYQQLVGKD